MLRKASASSVGSGGASDAACDLAKTPGTTRFSAAASAMGSKGRAIAALASSKGKEAATSVAAVAGTAAGSLAQAKARTLDWVTANASPDVADFVRDPSVEKLMANPQLLIAALSVLSAIKHPKAAVISALLNSKLKADAMSAAVASISEHATNAIVSEIVTQSDGMLPAALVKQAINNMDQDDMLQVVSLLRAL